MTDAILDQEDHGSMSTTNQQTEDAILEHGNHENGPTMSPNSIKAPPFYSSHYMYRSDDYNTVSRNAFVIVKTCFNKGLFEVLIVFIY